MRVSNWSAGIEDKRQTKIGNAGRQIGFEQDVLRLEVSVSDGRLAKITFRGRHLVMQVSQSTCHTLGDTAHFVPRNRITLKKLMGYDAIQRKVFIQTRYL